MNGRRQGVVVAMMA